MSEKDSDCEENISSPYVESVEIPKKEETLSMEDSAEVNDEPSLDGIEKACASQIYPKKQLISENDNLIVPYQPLSGESPNYIGCTSDGVIILSNYRLYFSGDTIVNIPLGLIEQVEYRDTVYLVIYCKDARSFRCKFPNYQQCAKWVKFIQEAILLPNRVDNLFGFVFYLWTKDEPREDLIIQLQIHGNEGVSEIYNEVKRMGLEHELIWRITEINDDYSICPSYPQKIIVPSSISDEQLKIVASYRFSGRIPAVVWRHQGNGCVIARCSQPRVGWYGVRKEDDEKLIQAIADACLMIGKPDKEVSKLPEVQPQSEDCKRKKLLIIDARSYSAAVANRLKGGGCESTTNYVNCEISFLDLVNIHSIRKSFVAIRTLCSSKDQTYWLSALDNSAWLQYISSLIKGALSVVSTINDDEIPVLVHCSDGWDRTAQVVALAELMMDPFYRSKKGFQVLVEREWLEFGHKFADRCGNSPGSEDLYERSPIFLQWLDCVHQIHEQFYFHFEFNSQYLVKLAYHTYSSLFGTFFCNTDEERSKYKVSNRTFSVWSYLNSNMSYHNYLYNNSNEVLRPSYHAKDIRFWKEVYSPTYVCLPKEISTCDEALPDETASSEGNLLAETNSFDNISSVGHGDPNIIENACFSESNQLHLKTETGSSPILDKEAESFVPSNIAIDSSIDLKANGDPIKNGIEGVENREHVTHKNCIIDCEVEKKCPLENAGKFEESLPNLSLVHSVSTSTTDLTKDEDMLPNRDIPDNHFLSHSVFQALKKQESPSSSSCSYATPLLSHTSSSGFPATPCDDAAASLSKDCVFSHQLLDIDGSSFYTEAVQDQIQNVIRYYENLSILDESKMQQLLELKNKNSQSI